MSKMTIDTTILNKFDEPISVELGKRFKGIYRLSARPNSIRDFAELLKASQKTRPREEIYIQNIREGKQIMGIVLTETKFLFTDSGDTSHFVKCGYDTLITAILSGKGTVQTQCLHCDQKVSIEVDNYEIISSEPRGIQFWFGAPPPGMNDNPVCDHLHLFPSEEHLQAWVAQKEREEGVQFSLHEMVEFINLM